MSYDRYARWRDRREEDDPVLSVVIPAYNEQQRIVPTIGAFAAHLAERGMSWELIVSDDGSSDDTQQLIELLNHANVQLLRAPANAGKGAAVRRGMTAAQGALVLFADADYSTPASELDKLLEAIEAGAEVAVGSRTASGARVEHRSFIRRLMTFGLRQLVRLGLQVPVEDTQCGFKLFRASAARRLFGAQTLDGFSFDLEILYLAARYRLRVDEVPVRWYDAPGSKVDARKEVVRFLTSIFRIRLNALRGVYADA